MRSVATLAGLVVGIKFRRVGEQEGALWRGEEGLAPRLPWNLCKKCTSWEVGSVEV